MMKNTQTKVIKPGLMLLSSLLILGGCATLPISDTELPSRELVGPEATNEWQAISPDSPDLITGAVQSGWLNDLNRPALTAFVEQTIEKNPNFLSTARLMNAAEANIGVTRASQLPQVGAGFSASRNRVSTPVNSTTNSLSLSLDASWEVDVWGRLSSQTEASRSDFIASKYDFEGARLSLAAQAAQAWFNAIETQQQKDLAERTVDSFTQSERIIRNRFNRGLTNGLDLRLATSNLEAAKSSLADREFQYGEALRQLEILAGDYPAGKLAVAGQLPNDITPVPVGLPMDILERRPDIQAAKARLLAEGYRAQSADKALLPSFAITASGGNRSDNFSDLLKFDDIFWNLIGNITQPIFQGGRLRYAAEAQQFRFEAQKQVFADTLLRALKEVEDALANDQALAKQVYHTTIAAENALAAEKVALDQYSRGLIPISTLLDSQRQSLNQQGQLLLIKRVRINNRIRLHLALGGDFATDNNPQALQQVTNQNSGI